jgi:hypothetical protein
MCSGFEAGRSGLSEGQALRRHLKRLILELRESGKSEWEVKRWQNVRVVPTSTSDLVGSRGSGSWRQCSVEIRQLSLRNQEQAGDSFLLLTKSRSLEPHTDLFFTYRQHRTSVFSRRQNDLPTNLQPRPSSLPFHLVLVVDAQEPFCRGRFSLRRLLQDYCRARNADVHLAVLSPYAGTGPETAWFGSSIGFGRERYGCFAVEFAAERWWWRVQCTGRRGNFLPTPTWTWAPFAPKRVDRSRREETLHPGLLVLELGERL